MCLTKSDMSDLLLKQNGCGVKVISTTGESSFFFYEDLDGTKGIDRAKYVHQNAHVIFFTNKWAQQYAFAKYMDHYKQLRNVAQKYPHDKNIQQILENFQDFLVAKLKKYTGFSTQEAKRQILRQKISFNKFTGGELK